MIGDRTNNFLSMALQGKRKAAPIFMILELVGDKRKPYKLEALTMKFFMPIRELIAEFLMMESLIFLNLKHFQVGATSYCTSESLWLEDGNGNRGVKLKNILTAHACPMKTGMHDL